jgi:AAA15 family ATPase/GTPase
MKIINVNLENYKSIKKSDYIELNDKINIFAGKNNTGKTALIEAIFRVVNCSHQDNPILETKTNLEIEITIDNHDLNFLNRDTYSDYLLSNVNRLKVYFSFSTQGNCSSIDKVEGFNNDLNAFQFVNNTGITGSHPSYVFTKVGGGGTTFGGRPSFITNVFAFLKERIVFISGTRHVPQSESTNLHNNLSIDGTNLNAFLYTLHNNNEVIFDEIKKVFTRIFNDVTSISTPINGNMTNISLYFEGNKEPIPLYNCGSGFTHVLILLCVLFTRKNCVVLFDEPHVFLHPSAEKAIYDLINEVEHHQYLLTTHSSILINYPYDKFTYLVKKEKGSSNFSKLNDIQTILSDIGINNSDFALSDKILFVEGETEEAIIPLILNHFGIKQFGYNYRILNMKGTGNEFSKKAAMTRHKEKLDLILGGITTSPIPYKILIDNDEKSEEKLLELHDKYGESLIIFDRREIENYFIDSYEVLAEIINDNKGKIVCQPADIEEFINIIYTHTDDRKLFPKRELNPIKNIVGSKVLELLFNNYELNYNKVSQGIQIVTLLLNNSPDKLLPIKEQLDKFMEI